MLTATVVFFSLFPLFFFGFPVSALLFPNEPISERWVKVPFLGLATVVLITQNLVYADIPVKVSTPWIWGLGLLIWAVWLFVYFRRIIPHNPIQISKLTFLIPLALLVIYVVQGFGLFGSSAKYYVGRAWSDEFNYVSIAQFLADYPFSTSSASVLVQPYAEKAIALKYDRIGQSIYHAFVACSSNTDAKTTFEVTIFLLPILTAIAIYWIARSNYSPHLALFALLGSGILPSLAMLHLESFLSQSLGMPFLLVFPFFIKEINDRFSIRPLLAGALVLSAAISIYTEFTLLYLIEIFLVCFVWFGNQICLRLEHPHTYEFNLRISFPEKLSLTSFTNILSKTGILIFITLLLNIGFFQGTLGVVSRSSTSGLLQGVYPWSFQVEGFTRLWFGDWAATPGILGFLLNVISIIATIASSVGLFLNWVKKKNLINFTFLFLCILPLGLLLLGTGYMYQFYKLQLTISPLYVIGLLYWVGTMPGFKWNHTNDQTLSKLRLNVIVWGSLISVFILSGASTFSMAYRSGFGKTQNEIGRGGGFLLSSPEMKELEGLLKSIKNTDIVVAYWDDFYNGSFINAWISYLTRNNRIFLTNSAISDSVVPDLSSQNIDLGTLSDHSVLITSTKPCGGKIIGDGATLLMENALVHVNRISSNNWVFLDHITNPNGIEKDNSGNPFTWIGDSPASMVVYSGKSQLLIIHPTVYPGLSLPIETPRTLEVTNLNAIRKITVQGEAFDSPIEIPVVMGRNDIKFQVLEKPTETLEHDPRQLLVNISNYCQFEISDK